MFTPNHKTKIVATIGPATDKLEAMINLIKAGLNIARLNYSHGDFTIHADVIKNLRKASELVGKPVTILADLPGPKMRIGKIDPVQIFLKKDDVFTLTTDKITGNQEIASVSFPTLHKVVRKDDILFLNDGLIQLSVKDIDGHNVICKVEVGGELRSFKGLNLPGIDLGISAFTEHDYQCLKSALENGVDAVSQSFVDGPEDILAVRKAARDLGYDPFIVAKIERAGALKNIDKILEVTDGIMIARGDLGVEIPIDQIAIVQKQLIKSAVHFGKPVITATQMMASMVSNPRPTRAEVTDVSNAILDGTDCIMLSEESAMGQYPFDSVAMLAKIAGTVEQSRETAPERRRADNYYRSDAFHLTDTISYNVQQSVSHLSPFAVYAHTFSGYTTRMIARFKLAVWILAVTENQNTFKALQFSYGVYPIYVDKKPDNWNQFIAENIPENALNKDIAIMVEGPSKNQLYSNHVMDIINLNKKNM
jgi:pyruvate kinase